MKSIVNSSSLRTCSPNWCRQFVYGEQRPDHFLFSALRTYRRIALLHLVEYVKRSSSGHIPLKTFSLETSALETCLRSKNYKPLSEEVIANSPFTDRNVDESLRGYFTKVSLQHFGVSFLCLGILRNSNPKTFRGGDNAGPCPVFECYLNRQC